MEKLLGITKETRLSIQINEAADKYGFQVPFDGTNNFYNDDKVKAFQDGAMFGHKLTSAPLLKRIESLESEKETLRQAVGRDGEDFLLQINRHKQHINVLKDEHSQLQQTIAELEKSRTYWMNLFESANDKLANSVSEIESLKKQIAEIKAHP